MENEWNDLFFILSHEFMYDFRKILQCVLEFLCPNADGCNFGWYSGIILCMAQPMRDGITLECCLPLADRIHRITALLALCKENHYHNDKTVLCL